MRKAKTIKKTDAELPKGFVLVITVFPKDGKCHGKTTFRGRDYKATGDANLDVLRSIFVLLRDNADMERKPS